MPANVRSIPALADFRAALITFGDSAKRALDEVRMEVQRGLTWVADEQPIYWKGEQQRSFDLVAERRSELESCQNRTMDGERATCYQERKALEAAKRYVRFVEEKIDTVRRWGRALVTETSEYEGQVTHLHDLLEIELPRALALLDRLIASLEGYTSISAAPTTVKLGQEPQTIARSTPEIEEIAAMSVFQQLREFTPQRETRQSLEILSAGEIEGVIETTEAVRAAAKSGNAPAEEADEISELPADEGACQQAALKMAYELQLAPAWPDWQAKVVLVAGCWVQPQVFLERIEAGQGDSGWFIGLVEPELGAQPRYEAVPLAALISLRPALLAACALPPGYLAVFSHDELVAVVSPAGEDLWERHLRALAEERLRDDEGARGA